MCNSYIIETTQCKKKECNEALKVIVSPIYSVVTTPVADIDLNAFSKGGIIVDNGQIDDYLVVKCDCGHKQRVYLKKK